MSSLNRKNKIIASTDKLVFSSKPNHHRLLHKFLGSGSVLKYYDFYSFPQKLFSFVRIKSGPIQLKNYSSKKYVSPFKNTHKVVYKDNHGRKIHLKYRLPGTSMAAITMEFYPTIKHGFDFNFIVQIFQKLRLNYKSFNITCMELILIFTGTSTKT